MSIWNIVILMWILIVYITRLKSLFSKSHSFKKRRIVKIFEVRKVHFVILYLFVIGVCIYGISECLQVIGKYKYFG